MAVFRQIQITYWQDKFVIRLTPEKKFFFLYLLSNSKTKQCGIYECPIKIMSFETGYDTDTISKLIVEFESFDKIKYDYTTEEIGIKNWRKYNETSSPKTQACIRKELLDVKSKVLLEYLGYEKPVGQTKISSNYRVSEKTKETVFDLYNGKCQKCGASEDLTIDHIFPRTLGGLSNINNLRILCRSCNSKRPLLGEELKKEIIESGFDYDSLAATYQYPIGGHTQEEEEEEEEEQKEDFTGTLQIWNSFAKKHGLAEVIKLSDKRIKGIKQRKSEKEFDLIKIFGFITDSPFLKGNNKTGWKIDFDFIFCSKNNYLKILEGKYNGTYKRNTPGGATAEELARVCTDYVIETGQTK